MWMGNAVSAENGSLQMLRFCALIKEATDICVAAHFPLGLDVGRARMSLMDSPQMQRPVMLSHIARAKSTASGAP